MINPFQPVRDIMPWYPFCIRTFLLVVLSMACLVGGGILISEGEETSTLDCSRISSHGGCAVVAKDKDSGKIAGGVILIIFGVPFLLTSIALYFYLGCGYNRFYTNNLIKFDGRGGVKRARRK